MLPSPGGVPWWAFWPIVAGSAAYGVRLCWRAIRSVLRGLRTAWRKVNQVIQIGQTLVDIAEEWKPNGGSSFIDRFDRVEGHATYTSQAVSAISDKVDATRGALDAHIDQSASRDEKLTELHEEFLAHQDEDRVSFIEVKGGLEAVRGAVDRVAGNVDAQIERKDRMSPEGSTPT